MQFRGQVQLLSLFILIPAVFLGQNKSNKGKEFWLGYGHNVLFTQGSPVNSQTLVLYLSAEQAAIVTVSVNSTGFSQTVNIPANTVVFSVVIPKSGADDARIQSEGLFARGIHIVSNVPIVVYAHQYGLFSSGATMLMPVETYGYTYYSINYSQVSNYPDSYSWFYVVASEDNTRLEITPSDSTEGGWEPNLTYTVNLNKGEIYNVFGKKTGNYTGNDMTGSKVVSVPGGDANCHPVAMFSGSSRMTICSTDGGEIMQQQVFPAQAWGTRYLTHHTLNNTNTNINSTFRNYYRICVLDPTTVVKRNGIVMTGFLNNFYYDVLDSTGGDYYTADKPIMVSQYTPNKNQCWDSYTNPYGDPEMFYLSPVEQGQRSVLFYTTSNFGIDYVYSNITIPTTGISSLRVDGQPIPASQIKVHPNNPAYSVAFANLSNIPMQHSITSDSAFTGIVNGLGFFESYGYNVGTFVNNLNAIGQIHNTGNASGGVDSFTCRQTPFRFYLKVAYPLSLIHWRLSQVAGITPNTDSIINNPIPLLTETINGRTYYTYTLQQDFTFTNQGSFYIPVTYSAPEIDNCSHSENFSIEVIVKLPPIADFSISGYCLKDTVFFNSTSVPGSFNLVSYLWNFDDATTQTTVNAAKKFTVEGPQNIRYRIYADNGCIGDTTKTITINPSPTAVLGVTSPLCAQDSVLISDTSFISSGSITTWSYDFGDGNTLIRNTNANFYHTYNLPGTYTIKLTVSSNNSCSSDTAFKSITVFDKPLAKFGYSGNICIGDSIHITDTSSISIGSIATWHYDFGDGNTLIRNNGSPFYHTYNTAGSFVLSLATVSDNGCISDTFRRTVVVSPKPTADFSITAVNCLRDTVFFNHITPPGSFNIVGYLWDFDDLSQQMTIDAKKKFLVPGVQNIRYRIFSDMGCIGDTTKTINISPDPLAVLGVAALGCTNTAVLISDTSSVSSGSIASWQYDFGDGNTLTRSVNTSFTHTYTTAGTYQVSLITFSALGCKSDTVRKTIVITDKPAATFSFSGTPCVGNTISFTSSYTNTTGATWYWDFGDGQTISTSAGNTITHVYTTAQANIIVKHLISIAGSVCAADTSFNTIAVIHDNPIASFSILKDTACENIPLQFLSAVTGISIWNWNFGNGTATTAPPFTRTYSTAGTYNVTLSVTDINNCISLPVTDVLVVNPLPVVNAGPDKLINFGASVLLTASVTPTAAYNYLWAPAAGLNANNILQPLASPQTNTTYLLQVENVNSHCKATDDVLVKLVTEVYIPNAFTPNGDSKNDRWNIPALVQYPDAVVTIFNRYGQKIYETKNYFNNPWDGTLKGTKQPNGSYVYYINLNDKRKQVFQGVVNIIR